MQVQRKQSFYEKFIKRLLDILCAFLAVIFFWWLYIIIAVLVRVKLGHPILFKQPRPGMIDSKTGRETIFDMYKFRTMSDARDEEGNPLPDEQRLSVFGRKLRGSSLDELPEVINILKGDMSVIGPRPQLVRDMVFMTDKQRMRHTAKPGLSGLAQISGRNALSWETKLDLDLKYIENISFFNDLKIVWKTFRKVFIPDRLDGNEEEVVLTPDYGDALLAEAKITQEQYNVLMREADEILADHER